MLELLGGSQTYFVAISSHRLRFLQQHPLGSLSELHSHSPSGYANRASKCHHVHKKRQWDCPDFGRPFASPSTAFGAKAWMPTLRRSEWGTLNAVDVAGLSPKRLHGRMFHDVPVYVSIGSIPL